MASKELELAASPTLAQTQVLENIISRVRAHVMTMIYMANKRDNGAKGDPKIGGHPSACSSAMEILSALHLAVREPQDFMACKPHASPVDHANHYLMELFEEKDGSQMSKDRATLAMRHLRHFPQSKDEPVFQSYHSDHDPDCWHYLPSGSVGIPPVNLYYLATALEMAKAQGFETPANTHFWCLIGDSEFREGSVMEAMPEVAERSIKNVTWIVDYNRQSLDGDRILNEGGTKIKDNDRIEITARANGWDVIQLRHGKYRMEIFDHEKGDLLRDVLENRLPDYEFQALMAKRDSAAVLAAVEKYNAEATVPLKELSADDVIRFMSDLGGHDLEYLISAFTEARTKPQKPTLVIAHTIKGNKLSFAAHSNNHSSLMSDEEVQRLRQESGLKAKNLGLFERFSDSSPEGLYLAERGQWFRDGKSSIKQLVQKNKQGYRERLQHYDLDKKFPSDMAINLKMVPYVHTQWMLGQITAKLTRISDTPEDDAKVVKPFRPLTADEKHFKPVADSIVTLAPDVGTSTNLNASMDGKIFGPDEKDYESEYGVKNPKAPDMVPHKREFSRHMRFDICEGNTMSATGSFGKMAKYYGIPYLPIMTVYDFFIKRALDQLFYNLYWQSSFILVGTPSGVSLSPEGAQHCWKSDFDIPNTVTWEPAYAVELEWVLAESMRRHFNSEILEDQSVENGNVGRTGVIIRAVTRALEQKVLMKRLKQHKRFTGFSDAEILEQTRRDCLAGGYYVVDYRDFEHYSPSENVVHIFTMGTMITEALKASDNLREKGIFANVIQVSSTDLLVGNLGDLNSYHHLISGLGISGDLYVQMNTAKNSPADKSNETYPKKQYAPMPKTQLMTVGEVATIGGRRIPVVSVHDGEPGLLDNIGSIVGTLQTCLATRKHSKSGRPVDVYAYHKIDSESVANAAVSILERSAFTPVILATPVKDAVVARVQL